VGVSLTLPLRQNASIGSLRFMFISDRPFKFLKHQLGSLSFAFVLDRSFKFFKYHIGLLSLYQICLIS
jgi:hypothetical protein